MDTKEWLQEYKKKLKCEECPESDPICLLFHHPIKDLKVDAIYKMLERKATLEEIRVEIDKCVVLCWNCHIKLHRELRDQSKFSRLDQFIEDYVFE